jgi:hypothetical protein
MKGGGRRVLLWALGLYAVAQVFVSLAIDRWQPRPFDSIPRAKYRELVRLARLQPDRPLLLMLGSSRTEGALDAARLSDLPGPDGKPYLAYNFGVPAAGPIHAWAYLRDLFDAGVRPRMLLVEYLPPLLGTPQRGVISEEFWTHAIWLRPRELNRFEPYMKQPLAKWQDWIQGRLGPCHAHRSHLHTWLAGKVDPAKAEPTEFPHDPWGWLIPNEYRPAELARRTALAWAMYFTTLHRLRIGEGPTRALCDLLEHCRREGIPVALVLMPEAKWFRSWYSAEGLADSYALLEELHDTYGAHVIDASEWLPDRDFEDGHHVLRSGADAFTARLREEVVRWSRDLGQ